MKKRFSALSLILTALIAAAVTAGAMFACAWGILGPAGLGLAEAVARINSRFVGEYDPQAAADTATEALVKGLGDRWSYYVDAEGYEALMEGKNNAYVGIGATVDYRGDEGLYVITVAKGGPGEKAGLLPGDTILAVDGVRLRGEDRNRGTELTRGPEGTTVRLTVKGEDGAERALSLTRATVTQDPVSYTLLDDKTGLITIQNFNSRCADEGMAAVDDLIAQGAQRLVFDLRNNGGGYLGELTKLLDRLLPEGIIFRSEDRQGRGETVRSDARCVDLPMAVLVNEDTYSAAEFFAAELRETGRGIVVGAPTFGKGYSQQTFRLKTGGGLNISTGKYFTGKGVSLIGTGVTLDEEVKLTEDQALALKRGSLAPQDDPQLQAALQKMSRP